MRTKNLLQKRNTFWCAFATYSTVCFAQLRGFSRKSVRFMTPPFYTGILKGGGAGGDVKILRSEAILS